MTSDPYDLISMSHSCNSGFGTVVVWNKGYELNYKIIPTPNFQLMPHGGNEFPAAGSIYPNPASENVNVPAKEGSAITVFDLMGHKVLAAKV